MQDADGSTAELMRGEGQSLHHQISAVLRANILAGRYAEDAYVPGETALMQSFSVSRATVRRALQTLEGEQLIKRQQGKGTLVVYRRPHPDVEPIEHHINRIEKGARQTTVRLLAFEWEQVPLSVQPLLELESRSRILKLIRMRLYRERPVRYIVNHIPEELGEKMLAKQFAKQTLVSVLEGLGRPPKRFDDEIGATLADPVLARALDVRIGAPLVEMSRLMFDGRGRPIAHQWTFIPPDRGKLRTSLKSGEW